MTTAFVIDIGNSGFSEHFGHGVASVHNLGFAHSTAACSCGWTGRRRYLKAAAEQDAWVHCMHDRCAVSSPLVIGW
jgi:hypothetical protein